MHTPLCNSIIPVKAEEYDEIAQYYLILKSAFLPQMPKTEEEKGDGQDE